MGYRISVDGLLKIMKSRPWEIYPTTLWQKRENFEAFGINLLHTAHDTNGEIMEPKCGLYKEYTKL